ncbi:MAG: FkbM family methyltransferase [Bacteroidota bacterium]
MKERSWYHFLFPSSQNNPDQVSHQKGRVTFSQSGEDIIIDHLFRILKIDHPTYIDVGAHHPYNINNTALLYERGCRGINIEPDPRLFENFVKYRKDDINLNIGISDEPAVLDFFVMSSPTLNTFSKEEAIRMEQETNYRIARREQIKVDTINNVVQQHHNGIFPDFFSLDVEGFDQRILKSIDFSVHRPAVICVETLTFSDQGLGIKLQETSQYLESKGYFMYADTYINSLFVDQHKWSTTS